MLSKKRVLDYSDVYTVLADPYNREFGAGYNSFAHSTLSTRLSNLFEAVRGNSEKTATALTYTTI
jgi:hypothetical protein